MTNVVAVKTAAPPAAEAEGAVADLRVYVPEGFSVGYSIDWGATEALIAGADAWYSVLAGLLSQDLRMDIRPAVQDGDTERARQLNARLAPLFDLFKTHTSLRVIYAAANLAGVCQADPPRPILPLAAEVQARISDVLGAGGLGCAVQSYGWSRRTLGIGEKPYRAGLEDTLATITSPDERAS